MNVEKAAVVGLGVIGGSLAKALNAAGIEVMGIDMDDETLLKARKDGVISHDSFNINEGDEKYFEPLKKADVVFLAIPVMDIVPVMRRLAPFFKKDAVVTDTGGTKRFLVNSINFELPEGVEFIGGHPMAGSEKSGYDHSREDLFLNAPYILTPTPENTKTSVETLKKVVSKIGAIPYVVAAEEHDRIIAAVSHLPQVVATSLAAAIGELDEGGEWLKLAGRGFKDTTRIAASSFKIWRDVFITNGDEIIKMIRLYEKKLEELAEAIESKDEGRIKKIFYEAKRCVERGENCGGGHRGQKEN
ncbi:Prephenate dehydrogenase [Fervidicola ferrireducens]|uniref:Prephenate dehydrogenase n=1 Tax=Fervidicola ferrireducens TaxID=520764 RepID=A0A140LBE1_9FIRM|nr:prephenate dehydrogenase/arogenate dehydrogenase family protein [Fervidicola ferrireducens]KXG77866.1 Prephenate dehydrogenase [Fervidicola ferrireducens]